MKKLKRPNIPSLQHFSRNADADPQVVAKRLIQLAKGIAKDCGYGRLPSLIFDMIVFNLDLDKILSALDRIPNCEQSADLKIIMNLISEYICSRDVKTSYPISGRQYPIGRDLFVPFNSQPLLVTDSGIIVPWYIFWKSNPVEGLKLRLFLTLARDLFVNDPDLETAKFEIVDLSCPSGSKNRDCRIIETASIPSLPDDERDAILSSYVAGHQIAIEEIERENKKYNEGADRRDPLHDDLFSFSDSVTDL